MPNPELRNPDDPFLAPIEDPTDPALQQLYATLQARVGKVFTLAKVLHARLPGAFAQFFGSIPMLDAQLALPAVTVLLIREQVARMNVCLFCIDSVRAATIRASMNQAKFDALGDYRTSPLFSAAERAVLDYVTELTRDRRVDPSTFDRMAEHISEREICDVVYVVASEHLFNVLSNALNVRSDMICDIARKAKTGEVPVSVASSQAPG